MKTNDFEEALSQLKPKLLNLDYANRVYGSLCNIEWIHEDAPADWYNFLEQQNAEWERKNAAAWRKWPRNFCRWLRGFVIPWAYKTVDENGYKVSKSCEPWNKVNVWIMNLEYKFWVYPEPSPWWVYSCSWRYAGGLVAEIRDVGEDYMYFYCNGNEETIDEQFEEDMEKLGWKPIRR